MTKPDMTLQNRLLRHKLTTSIAATAGLLVTVIGLSACGSSSSSTAATSSSTTAAQTTRSGAAGGGSNARSGPARWRINRHGQQRVRVGLDLSTSAGEKVTIKQTSSTKYEKGTTAASKSAVAKGATVLVLGTDNNTTITATEVIVGPPKPNSKTTSR